ncbi:MAG: hypothetical protein ACOYYS_12850 [Chloroflexota bacterium]
MAYTHVDKSSGQLIRSADWNDMGHELVRLETAKVNRSGDTIGGDLKVTGHFDLGNSDLYFTQTDHKHSGLGNANGCAAIENASDYDALMILGRAHDGGRRVVKLWDYLEVHGELKVTGPTAVGGDLQLGGAASFGKATRQMLNLWDTAYGIGVQNSTQYFRSGKNFAWYKNGAHSDDELSAGANGIVQMALQDGRLGIGTAAPKQALDVRGRIHVEHGVIQRGGDPITNTSDLGLFSQVEGSHIRIVTQNAPIRFYTDGGAGTQQTLSIEKDRVDISKAVNIAADLKVTGVAALSGSLSLDGAASFGKATRQMLNLWDTAYGIGVQNSTQYFRSGKNFAWYKNGAHSDDELSAGANGIVQMALQDGRLGIGTAAPKQALDVRGRIHVEHGVIQRGGDPITNTSDLGLFSQVEGSHIRIVTQNAPIRFYTDGGAGTQQTLSIEKDRVDISKAVNIAADLKVTGALALSGSASLDGAVNFGKATRQMLNLWGTVYGIGIQNSTQYFRSGKNFAWYKNGAHDDNELSAGANGIAQMVLRDGNLGVGTDTPQARLQVVEGAIMPSHGKGESAGILFPQDAAGGSGDRGWIRYYARSGEAMTLAIGIENDGDDHIALIPSGNVGIGTDNPAAKLEVVGTFMERLEIIACSRRDDWKSQNHPIMQYFRNKLWGKPAGTMIRAIQDHPGWRGHYWQGWVDADGKIRVVHNYYNTNECVIP